MGKLLKNALKFYDRRYSRTAPDPAPTPLSFTAGEDFESVTSVTDLLEDDLSAPNRVFCHDADIIVAATPHGMVRGKNVFGGGDSPVILSTPDGQSPMRNARSFAMDGAILLPQSTAIVTRDNRLLNASVESAMNYWGGIEYVEPQISDAGTGVVGGWDSSRLPFIDHVAVSPLGVGHANYGHFLFDGLPLVYLLMNAIGRERGVSIVTPSLVDWQREVFALIGFAERLHTINTPHRFKTLISNSQLSLHVSYPSRYCRPLFDALRFAVPARDDAPEKIFIRRPDEGTRRMRNLDSLADHIQRRGFTVLRPEQHTVRDQIRLFSRAKVIVAQTGAALANACFAPVGAKILEIMPECYPDQWTRSTSRIMGHHWHVLFVRVPDSDKRGLQVGGKFYPGYDFSFELDLNELDEALHAIGA